MVDLMDIPEVRYMGIASYCAWGIAFGLFIFCMLAEYFCKDDDGDEDEGMEKYRIESSIAQMKDIKKRYKQWHMVSKGTQAPEEPRKAEEGRAKPAKKERITITLPVIVKLDPLCPHTSPTRCALNGCRGLASKHYQKSLNIRQETTANDTKSIPDTVSQAKISLNPSTNISQTGSTANNSSNQPTNLPCTLSRANELSDQPTNLPRTNSLDNNPSDQPTNLPDTADHKKPKQGSKRYWFPKSGRKTENLSPTADEGISMQLRDIGNRSSTSSNSSSHSSSSENLTLYPVPVHANLALKQRMQGLAPPSNTNDNDIASDRSSASSPLPLSSSPPSSRPSSASSDENYSSASTYPLCETDSNISDNSGQQEEHPTNDSR